jgi:4-diphosphocytidyl-2-C-methyl-D-erythritol kinase
MIAFPNAKINLGLHIVGRRTDGYHDLDTVFMPVPLCDVLEIISNADAVATLTVLPLPSGKLPVWRTPDCDTVDNLVMKAYRLYQPPLPCHMYLYKHIPMGAGMGGGSSDATYTLRMLDKLFEKGGQPSSLREMARQLGADCPFFLHNTPCHATGIGDVLTPISLTLAGYTLVVVKPPLHISTAEAFQGVQPRKPAHTTKDIVLREPVEAWRDLLHNDFEDSLFPRYPLLAALKTQLYASGAVYASMTGSGAALYGLYPTEKGVQPPPLPSDYFVWTHSWPLL